MHFENFHRKIFFDVIHSNFYQSVFISSSIRIYRMLRFHLAVAVFCSIIEMVLTSCQCWPCMLRMCMPMPCLTSILCRPTICPAPIPCPPPPVCPPQQPLICPPPQPPPICPQPQITCMVSLIIFFAIYE